MEMKTVFSSNVEAIGYDPDSQEFHVTWLKSGKTSVYFDVPPAEAEQVLGAPSIGEAVNAVLKQGGYAHGYKA